MSVCVTTCCRNIARVQVLYPKSIIIIFTLK